MNFDGRLVTVLGTEVRGPHDRAVRWRQLVDLVARADASSSAHLLVQAIAALRDGRDEVAVPLRAAAARSIAGRELPTELLALFAGDALEVAAPLLTGRTPSAEILEAASPEVRRFLRAMSVEQSEPMEESPVRAPIPAKLPDSTEPMTGVPTIGDFVARIERLRTEREALPDGPPIEDLPLPMMQEVSLPTVPAPLVEAPAAPSSSPIEVPDTPPANVSVIDELSPALFRWECGPGGQIGWVEGAPRGPLVGRTIARAEGGEGVDADVERAFSRRTPFRDATLMLPETGVVGGNWLISGVPAFAPTDGRFVGYRGIARRSEMLRPAAMDTAPAAPLDPASMRELVHEIKTPLNAIIGFAEIIDGQYFGPAQTGYRTRAAEIVAQAHILLAAIDDLDFAARLRGRGNSSSGELLNDFFAPLTARLEELAGQQGATLTVTPPPAGISLDRELVERLVERFVGAALAVAERGESLAFGIRRDPKAAAFTLTRPAALGDWDDSSLTNGDRAAMALRLVAGLAQIVGGSLERDGSQVVLRLPLATAAPVGLEGLEPPT